jgi:hypothetical protein
LESCCSPAVTVDLCVAFLGLLGLPKSRVIGESNRRWKLKIKI